MAPASGRSATQGRKRVLAAHRGVYAAVAHRGAASGNEGRHQRVTKGRWQDRTVGLSEHHLPRHRLTEFWIDAERNVVMRMILAPAPNAGTMDIRLDGYVPLAGGWLATKVAMSVGGAPVQTEEYSEWKANVELAPALFDPASWTTAPHWAAARAKNP
jgi:hypothetical protein